MRRGWPQIYCLFFLLSFHFLVRAQEKAVHKIFDDQDGLQIEYIQDMAYDQDNFLWLAGGVNLSRLELFDQKTPICLQRFDGMSFHSIPLPEEIVSIYDIHRREDNQFFLSTNKSLYLFDPISTQIEWIDLKFSPNINISRIKQFQDKTFVLANIGLEVVVYQIHPNLSVEEYFRFSLSQVNKIKVDHNTIFIPFDDFVVISDDNFPITFVSWEGKILKMIDPQDFENKRENALRKKWIEYHFEQDGHQYVILDNNPQLYRIDSKNMELVLVKNDPQISLDKDHLSTVVDDLGNSAVITNYHTTMRVNRLNSEKSFETYYQKSIFELKNSFVLRSKNLNRELWLASRGTLHYFKFPQKQMVKNLLPGIEIRAMTSLNNLEQLIATEFDGWFVYNALTERIKPYPLYENGKEIKLHASRNFFQIDKTLWSNDASGGIVAVDTLTHQIEYFRHYPVICMVKPTDSTLIYGTKKYHLMEFDMKQKIHKSLLPTDSLDIYDLEWQAKDHTIIAATDKGLLTYDLSSQKHRFYNHPNQLKDPFLLMADYHPDYGYILGSRTGIVTTFNLETQQFKILYEDELKAGIATVLFDDHENWWINTFNGIVSFYPETGKTIRYSDKDGFSNNEANRYSALKTSYGFLVGTIQGLNFFKPEDLSSQFSEGQLKLIWLYAYNKEQQQFFTNFNRRLLSENKPIVLPPEHRTLEVYFSLSELDLSRNERYRYRLNNSEWVDLGSERSVRFPNMAVGDHLMEIEALDFSGNRIGASLFLHIQSKNFFYKTGWFYLCITLVFMGSALWVIRQQWLRKKLQDEFARSLIESREEERSRIAKELHDGVGQQLSFIKRQLLEQHHAMSEMATNTLEEVRNISKGLYPAIIKQLGLTGSIEQLLFDLDKQTDLFVSTAIDEVDDSFDEKTTLHIYRVVQEAISNILKHAFPLNNTITTKTVSVDILQGERAVTIIVQDNGKGFDPIKKQKKNSLGLKTMEERIRILGGVLTLDSHQRVGTTLTAKIPHSHA